MKARATASAPDSLDYIDVNSDAFQLEMENRRLRLALRAIVKTRVIPSVFDVYQALDKCALIALQALERTEP